MVAVVREVDRGDAGKTVETVRAEHHVPVAVDDRSHHRLKLGIAVYLAGQSGIRYLVPGPPAAWTTRAVSPTCMRSS